MSLIPRNYPEPETDRLAIVVRGVCGAVLGVVFGGYFWLRSGGFGFGGSIVVFGASIVACVHGAIRHGDSFWLGLLGRGR